MDILQRTAESYLPAEQVNAAVVTVLSAMTCVKVHLSKDTSRAYALKKMKKKFIVDTRQQQHVMQEKKLLLTVRCPFIVRSAALLTLSPCHCVIAVQFCCRPVSIQLTSCHINKPSVDCLID